MTYDMARLSAEIARDEGDKLRVYRCTEGKRSIGRGRNLDDVGISAEETRLLGITLTSCLTRGITQVQSDALFANDIKRSERDLDAKLPWWRTLNGVRQRVLLNMCFNMGIGRAPDAKRQITGAGLLGFYGTLPKLQRGDWAGAVAGMKASKWHDQVGARAIRLEAMMLTGKEPK
ncbi:glycoside hydrolase family protein [Sphingomonas sp. LB2R24]|uniref:glycoside hydrolase family protein n=1 Tax=Sphingomonas sorbitolis TaxID=3096165 RepID=UPI002FC9E0DE